MDKRAFEFIQVLPRQAKPRTKGITFVEDAYFSTMGLATARDLMQWGGEFIDIIKMAATTTRYQSREFIREKVAIYRQHEVDVFVGGIFTELALAQRAVTSFIDETRYLGVNVVEVSDSAISLTLEQKMDLVRYFCREGFKVFAESGRKMADTPMSVSATVGQIEKLRSAGAFKVIVESDEVENALSGGDPSGAGRLLEVASAAGAENIIIETPLGASYKEAREFFWWAIQNLGPEVNVGNVAPDHVTLLEMMRHGTYWRGWAKFVDTSFAEGK